MVRGLFKKISFDKVLKFIPFILSIIGIIIGAWIFIGGVNKLNQISEELTDKSVDELVAETSETSAELTKKIAELQKEEKKNGLSDKYFEISREIYDLSVKNSKAINSRFKKENGAVVPETLAQKINAAPELLYGIGIIVAAIAAAILIQKSLKRL